MEFIFKKASKEDLEEILKLQYIAYQSEAKLLGNNEIPPLKQTIDEVNKEYQKGVILKVVNNFKIIGSVRMYEDCGTVYIGKLMVHPDYQRHGLGAKLLLEVEKYFPNKRYELFTSTLSKSNIAFYEKNGYRCFKQEAVNDTLSFVYMEKFEGED